MNSCNNLTNGNLKRLCKMLREWKDMKNVDISGYAIDTLAYNFIKYWNNRDKSYTYYDWMTRDFFKFLSEQDEYAILLTPGSSNRLFIGKRFNNKANTAYEKTKEAIADEEKYPSIAKKEWSEIYGTKFPN